MCRKYILIIFMTFISILLLNTSEVSATFDFDYNGNFYSLPDLPAVSENFDGEHFSIFSFNGGFTLLTYVNYVEGKTFVSTSDTNNGTFAIPKDGSADGRVKIWYISNDGSSWYMNSWQPTSWKFNYYSGEFSSQWFIYSSVDIYKCDGNGNPDISTVLFNKSALNIPFPSIANAEDISTNKDFQKVYINANNINTDFKITIQQDYYPFPELEDINANYGPSVSFEISQDSVNFEYLGDTKLFYINRQVIENTFNFINNQSYSFWFSYLNDEEEVTSLVTKIETKWKTSEQVTEDNISNINDFFKDDTFNKDTITNNMPNSDSYNDPTSNSFDNFFNTLKNAFTSENYQDIVLPVPFTDGEEIIIPNNLTENIVPNLLKNLIRMVYWFILSRYIAKDIASYIEKAKSGDIFSHTDTNIKTDML